MDDNGMTYSNDDRANADWREADDYADDYGTDWGDANDAYESDWGDANDDPGANWSNADNRFDGDWGDANDDLGADRQQTRERRSTRDSRGHSARDNRKPYVRKPRPRKTQEAINDFEQDESFSTGFTHDSNVTVRGRNPLSGTVYSRSRANMPQLQRSLHYGQYLEIPKGKRQIFSSRERASAIKSRAIIAIIVILLVIVAIIAWNLIAANMHTAEAITL